STPRSSFSFLFRSTLYSPPLSLFFSTAPSTTEISTLSLHDALPISVTFTYPGMVNSSYAEYTAEPEPFNDVKLVADFNGDSYLRSEEHTSELQSRENLVCRLLLEKKKNTKCRSRYRSTGHRQGSNSP